MKFLKSSEKKKIVNELDEQFGINSLDYMLIETGKKKIRGFSGSMTKEEIKELGEIANVEIVGIYLFKKENKLRLSLDGSMILKERISKSIVEIDNEQLNDWINGKNLEDNLEKGIYVVKSKNKKDILGCGIFDGKKLINHVPRERRVRRS